MTHHAASGKRTHMTHRAARGLMEQALEMTCSASTKTQMAHMKGGTATEKN